MNTPLRDTKYPTYCNPFGLNGKSGVKCDISGSTLPFPDMLPFLTESNNLPIETHNGQAKDSISTYTIDIKNKYVGQLYYEWSVSAGAEILQPYDIHSEKIQVKTNSATDVSFDVTCNVTDDDRMETVTENYTHQRVVGEGFLVLTAITETQVGVCTFETQGECTAISKYQLNHANGTKFEWFVDNGTIIEGQGTDAISVETVGNADITINVLCKVSNSVSFGQIDDNFVHDRTENVIPEVTMTVINEDIVGECGFETNLACVATSTHTTDALNHDTIYWSLLPGSDAKLVGPIVGDSIRVETQGDEDITFTLRASASNTVSNKVIEQTFIHDRTEIPVIPIVITNIEEIIVGSCEFLAEETCIASGEYKINQVGGTNFQWSVVGNATLVNGFGTDTITVSSDSNSDETFTLTCIVSNSQYGDTASSTFTHTRTEILDPVAIVSLSELSVGSCEFPSAETCEATSTYQVVGTDYDTIVWNITGATLVSGQGTDTVTVSTDSGVDTLFDVGVTLNGFFGGSANASDSYSHTRIEIQEVFDQALLYDVNNIATEFIEEFTFTSPIAMTATTQDGYTVTDNGSISATTGGYQVFNTTGIYHSANQYSPYIITLELPIAEAIRKIEIENRTESSSVVWSPDTIVISGSNDNITFDQLANITGISDISGAITNFDIGHNTDKYLYYKIYATNNQSYCAIKRIDLVREII